MVDPSVPVETQTLARWKAHSFIGLFLPPGEDRRRLTSGRVAVILARGPQAANTNGLSVLLSKLREADLKKMESGRH
jgi:hypothetical protein